MAGFDDFGLSKQLLLSIKDMGFEEPTPVQAQAIPALLEGRDVVAQALTGTGKTAAFGIPIVQRINVKKVVPQAVVLTPTRELAVQVSEQLSGIGRHKGLQLVPIYGGQPIDRQLRALGRGVHAIVATPGRMMDHMRRGTVNLSSVSMLVLDEADEMLNMGFLEDVEFIMSNLAAERLTALFSATIPDTILRLAERYMRSPDIIQLSRPKELTVPEIDQVFFQVPYARKMDALCRTLEVKQPERTLVFCATKRTVDDVVETLQGRGYLAAGLHGDMSQSVREKALRSLRTGQVEVLVATDVAARGLDIPDVSHVINFDIPPDVEYYVHRIGRTGRLGRKGEAITFVNPWEMRELRIIERITGARIRREEVPSLADAEDRETQQLRERVEKVLEAGRLGRYREMAESLMNEHDPMDVAAAALSLIATRRTRGRGEGREEPPVREEAGPPRPKPFRRQEQPHPRPRMGRGGPGGTGRRRPPSAQ